MLLTENTAKSVTKILKTPLITKGLSIQKQEGTM